MSPVVAILDTQMAISVGTKCGDENRDKTGAAGTGAYKCGGAGGAIIFPGGQALVPEVMTGVAAGVFPQIVLVVVLRVVPG